MPPVLAGVLQRAVTLLAHLELDIHRGREGRGRLAHDLVVGRPFHRLVPEVLVPDLADAGIVPADHIIAGLCGSGDGKARDSDAGGGTEGSSATHDESPVGRKCYPGLPGMLCAEAVSIVCDGRTCKWCGKSVTVASRGRVRSRACHPHERIRADT